MYYMFTYVCAWTCKLGVKVVNDAVLVTYGGSFASKGSKSKSLEIEMVQNRSGIGVQPVFVQQHVFEGDFWAKFGTLNSICVAQKRLLVAKFQSDGVQTLPHRMQFSVFQSRH